VLPPFNADGNLPEGIHQASLTEVLARFGVGSARRKWLGDRMGELLSHAKTTGKLHRVFLWGSYVTAKKSPNDLDLLLVMAEDFSLDQLRQEQRVLFDHAQARIRFQADVFWTKVSIGQETLELWLDTYQVSKDLNRRGIVEVIS
jgi:hypothetical protein